jgi:hypothetical protein
MLITWEALQRIKESAMPLPPYPPGTDPKAQAPAAVLVGEREPRAA